MTTTVNIVSRWDAQRVLFSADLAAGIPETNRMREAVQMAAKRGADLGRANLSGANLSGANLVGADLGGADLGGADLRGANLRWADLVGANLGRANLGDADLRGADLRGADLGGADLGDADLGGADLGGADLRGADLRWADLGGAKIKLSSGSEIELADCRTLTSIGPIGSEGGTLMIYREKNGALYAARGCFGPAPVADFLDAVERRHGDNAFGRAYRAAVEMARAWAEAE